MTGLEKMVNQILEEAKAAAEKQKADAAAQAEQIREQGKAEAQKLAAEIARKSEAEIANYQERMKSSADLKRRTALLAAKQELIAQTIQKAYEKFCAMEDQEYFDVLKKMLKTFVRPEEGVIAFSAQDQKKFPADFEKAVAKIAEEKGGKLTVSTEAVRIDRGFVLSYGGIEENCSFKSLFDSRKDEFQDLVQKMLFM